MQTVDERVDSIIIKRYRKENNSKVSKLLNLTITIDISDQLYEHSEKNIARVLHGPNSPN